MRLDECYRLLEIDPEAADEEVKRAHRDLTKVWHPDRFGHDAALRRKAEEKLKAINEAYETILGSRPERDAGAAPPPPRQPHGLRRRSYGLYAVMFALLGAFVLFRRPSPVGLAIALLLFVIAFVLAARMRL